MWYLRCSLLVGVVSVLQLDGRTQEQVLVGVRKASDSQPSRPATESRASSAAELTDQQILEVLKSRGVGALLGENAVALSPAKKREFIFDIEQVDAGRKVIEEAGLTLDCRRKALFAHRDAILAANLAEQLPDLGADWVLLGDPEANFPGIGLETIVSADRGGLGDTLVRYLMVLCKRSDPFKELGFIKNRRIAGPPNEGEVRFLVYMQTTYDAQLRRLSSMNLLIENVLGVIKKNSGKSAGLQAIVDDKALADMTELLAPKGVRWPIVRPLLFDPKAPAPKEFLAGEAPPQPARPPIDPEQVVLAIPKELGAVSKVSAMAKQFAKLEVAMERQRKEAEASGDELELARLKAKVAYLKAFLGPQSAYVQEMVMQKVVAETIGKDSKEAERIDAELKVIDVPPKLTVRAMRSLMLGEREAGRFAPLFHPRVELGPKEKDDLLRACDALLTLRRGATPEAERGEALLRTVMGKVDAGGEALDGAAAEVWRWVLH